MNDVYTVQDELLSKAQAASKHAYSPYSRIKVGAVVVGQTGRLYSGCNMENASYGLTQCAERNALAAAIAGGEQPGKMKTILIYSSEFKLLSPCGACRQVMSELLAKDAQIISCSAHDECRTWTIGQLLPAPFCLE